MPAYFRRSRVEPEHGSRIIPVRDAVDEALVERVHVPPRHRLRTARAEPRVLNCAEAQCSQCLSALQCAGAPTENRCGFTARRAPGSLHTSQFFTLCDGRSLIASGVMLKAQTSSNHAGDGGGRGARERRRARPRRAAEEDDALLVGGTLSTARSTVVRCRRGQKRVLGDALSDVKRIREIRSRNTLAEPLLRHLLRVPFHSVVREALSLTRVGHSDGRPPQTTPVARRASAREASRRGAAFVVRLRRAFASHCPALERLALERLVASSRSSPCAADRLRTLP